MRIGWYVHHHGGGHRTRARLVGRELAAGGAEVTLLGSGLGGGVGAEDRLSRVDLPLDHPLPSGWTPEQVDATGRGQWHWAPLRTPGYQQRMSMISAWVTEEKPDLMVVDVSCEVSVLVRLLGVPVVVVAQPGDRRDPAHHSTLAAASAILAPWPAWATADIWRTGLPATEMPPVFAVGGLAPPPWSQPSSQPARPKPGTEESGRGLILAGRDGFDDPGLVGAILRAVPELDWTVADGAVSGAGVATAMAGCDVVVVHGGQNAVAEVATLQRPAVLVPQSRPFREQHHLARVVGAAQIGEVATAQRVHQLGWAALVKSARTMGGAGWQMWGCEGAVARAADVIRRQADG